MKFIARQALKRLTRLVVSPGLEPALQASRIQTFQRDIVLPIKLLLIFTLVYYFYFSNWIDQTNSTREVALGTSRHFFLFYVLATITAGGIFIGVKRDMGQVVVEVITAQQADLPVRSKQ